MSAQRPLRHTSAAWATAVAEREVKTAPLNTAATTATDVGALPAVLSQNVHDAGVTYTVWYRYTATADVNVVAVFPWGGGLANAYKPRLSVYLGPPSAPVPYLDLLNVENRPVQHPTVAGVTYYYKIAPSVVNPSPAVLALEVHPTPNTALAAGALLVNDDSSGFPAALVGSDGVVGQFWQPVAAGEEGDVLATSGRILLDDNVSETLYLYDADGTELLTIPFPRAGTDAPIRACQGAGVWYVCASGASTTAVVSTVSAEGALSGTSVTLTGNTNVGHIAAANDQTVLYFVAHGNGQPLKRWNLSTNSAAADLAAGIANFKITDLLVLADTSIVACYRSISVVRLLRYSAAGAVLNDYTLTTGLSISTSADPRLAYAIDDPTSVWVWLHLLGDVEGTYSRFLNVRLSDGALVATRTVPVYEVGIYEGERSASFPGFGTSYSCPFVVLRAAVAPPDGGGPGPGPGPDVPPYGAPSYHLDARYIRRLRRAPHVTAEHVQLTYRRLQVDLEPGVGVVAGQGADPEVLLRMSRDGGHTWGEPLSLSAGPLGAYATRVIARRLGVARDAVFEIVVSDPVAWHVIGAWLDADPGTH